NRGHIPSKPGDNQPASSQALSLFAAAPAAANTTSAAPGGITVIASGVDREWFCLAAGAEDAAGAGSGRGGPGRGPCPSRGGTSPARSLATRASRVVGATVALAVRELGAPT